MKRKLLAGILAAVLSVSVVTACGSSTAGTKEEQITETDESVSSDVETEEMVSNENDTEDMTMIHLTRCTFNLGAINTEQTKKVEDAINAYIADKIHVQIALTDISSADYTDKVNLSLANNEINLLWTASWEPTIGTNDLVETGAVYDITDLLPESVLYHSISEGQWEATKYDGKNYFVPVYKDNVEGYDFMFRGDLVEKYGWDTDSVKELKDLEPMLADAKAEGVKYPFLTQKCSLFYRWYIDQYDFFTNEATSTWVAVDRETNEVVNTVLTEDYKEFCLLMAEWAEKGYISEDDVTKTTPETVGQTKDWAISWWTDIPVNVEAESRYGQEVTIVPATSRWAHSTSALGSCYAITANSTTQEAEACIDFLGLLYTDSKLADLYTFGIEGEDFDYNENGQVVQHSENYNHSMWESASATIVTPLENEPMNKAELYEAFNGSANTSCAAGFRVDKSPVEAKFAACQNVFDQYGYVLENGGYASADIDSVLEEYQRALDEAGYQEVLAEFQKQYEEWK